MDGTVYKGLMVVWSETPQFVKALCKEVLRELLEHTDVDELDVCGFWSS